MRHLIARSAALALIWCGDAGAAPLHIVRLIAPRANGGSPPPANCKSPRPGPRDQIVVVGGYEGSSMADVTLAGQDVPTTAATIVIESGERPLFLVLSTYDPMIWRIEGATRRVSRVVVASQETTSTGVSASGVAGLPQGKVTAIPRGCFGYFYPKERGSGPGESTNLARPRQDALKLLGRGPDVLTGAYSLKTVSLPSGTVVGASRGKLPPPKGFDPGSWRDAIRFTPDGLARFDPKRISGAVPAVRYQVLPQEFGLAQLTASGALRRNSRSDYVIVRPIARFPGGLHGAHMVTFRLAAGVPRPAGDPGHSNVLRDGAPPAR